MGKQAQRNPQTQGELEAQRQGYINGMQVAMQMLIQYDHAEAYRRLHDAAHGEQLALNSMRESLKVPLTEYTKLPKLGVVHVTEKNIPWAAIKTNRTIKEVADLFAAADEKGIVCAVEILEKKES